MFRLGRLLAPVDAAWLFAFRVAYGVVLSVSMLRFLAYGWVERLFVTPQFHFKYWGFGWVEPLSASGMHALFVALAVLSVAIALGFAFRLAAPLFAFGLSYVQLIDVSTYLNHYYLAALLAWLLCASPANRSFSVDALLARRSSLYRRLFVGGSDVSEQDAELPVAWLYLFRAQVGIVYVFAGLAKAQPDWLVHAQPLRIWLGPSLHLPVLGPVLALDYAPLVLSWCGFLFDTSIVLFLLSKRTRLFAYGVVLVFHALTRVLFPIGMFPAIMAVSALVFFEPEWPRALIRRIGSWLGRPLGGVTPSAPSSLASHSYVLGAVPLRHRLALGLGIAYSAVQLLLPLRFIAYGGNVLWHEQGMRFSWRVMVRAKGGNTTFVVRNPESGHVWHVSPRSYLTGLQESEMSSQPDLILQLAHHVHQDFVRRGLGPVEVRADSKASLNGRRGSRLIDPSVDLVSVRDGLGHADWVLPAPDLAPARTKPVL